MKKTTVAAYGNKLPFDKAPEEGAVVMYQRGRDKFDVVYGLQVHAGLTYSQAAMDFGCCVMHYEACNGRLDNRMPGER